MTNSLKTRLVVGVIAVFFAGVATGIFVGVWHVHYLILLRHSGHLGDRMREHFRRELQLTPAQFEKISPTLDTLSKQLENIRQETGQKVSHAMKNARDEISPNLNPAQREKLQELEQRHRRFLRAHGAEPPPPEP